MRYCHFWTFCLPIIFIGCASTGSPSGSIAVETASVGQPVSDAQCTVSTLTGSWNITTPATVNVGDPNGALRIICNKKGYRTSEMIFRPPTTSSGSNVGIGIGGGNGHVGVGLSFPIGLNRSSAYPGQVTIELNPE